MDLRKSRAIGRRTRRDILKGKNVRQDKDGCDVYEDYFTESDDEESSSFSTKSTYSAKVKEVNRNVSNAVVEDQQPTFISANSKREFSKKNEAELENTVSKASFSKSSLLLQKVSDIRKSTVQMQNILPGYDDLDLQIMQMCQKSDNITDKNVLSHKKNQRSKADKNLSENSKSRQKENSIKETRECTDELSTDDEYDLELLGKKLQNASYASPAKHLNETYVAVNSPENSDSEATLHEEGQFAHNSSDKYTEVSIRTTRSGRSQKKSSPKKRKTIDKSRSENKENNTEHVQLFNTTSNYLDNSFKQVSSQKGKTIGKNRNENEEINSEHTFTSASSQKRKTTGGKGSDHIQPINAASNSPDNSFEQISLKKRKTIRNKRNEDVEINSDHVQSVSTASNSLHNSFQQLSNKRRKATGKNRNENEEVNSDHVQSINTASKSLDNSFKQSSKKRETIGEKRGENEEVNSEDIQPVNEIDISIDNSFKRISSEKRKTNMKKRNKQINSTKKQNKGKKLSRKSKSVSNNAGCIRKSNRQRFPPLAHWRNERLLFHCVQGELNILGVDKGTGEDDAAIKCIYKRYSRDKEMKTRKKLSKPFKFGLINVAENDMLVADVIKKFSLTPWNVSEKQMKEGNRPYLIKRMFETEKNGFGFLQIDVDKEKPEQYMPDDDLHLTVIRGKVKLTIQDNSYEVSEKDMFIIPRNCAYSIKNVGSIKALLSYVVGKFQFLESLKG